MNYVQSGSRRSLESVGLPPTTPRGPRNDNSRDNSRDHRGRDPPANASVSTSSRAPSTAPAGAIGSLRSRIGEKDDSSPSSSSRDVDQDVPKKRTHEGKEIIYSYEDIRLTWAYRERPGSHLSVG